MNKVWKFSSIKFKIKFCEVIPFARHQPQESELTSWGPCKFDLISQQFQQLLNSTRHSRGKREGRTLTQSDDLWVIRANKSFWVNKTISRISDSLMCSVLRWRRIIIRFNAVISLNLMNIYSAKYHAVNDIILLW